MDNKMERNSDIQTRIPDGDVTDFRMLSQHKCKLPRRYVIAIMMFLLLVIQEWRLLNIEFLIVHALTMEDAETIYPTIANWTIEELNQIEKASWCGSFLSLIPSALLIHRTSSHIFLSVSVVLSSVLHLLTPVALEHHSLAVIIVISLQSALTPSTKIAVLSMWRNWAPPDDRTLLVVLSFSGYFIAIASSPYFYILLESITDRTSFYIAGAVSLVWSLLWYFIIFDAPSADPFISEAEYLYLQNNIPSEVKEANKITDIPWKKILTSKSLYALCPIYFKVAFSFTLLPIMFALLTFQLYSESRHSGHSIDMDLFYLPFCLWHVVALPSSALLMSFLDKKYRLKKLMIRKITIFSVYCVHVLILLGTFSSNFLVKAVCFWMSYATFSLSIPGYISIALDLSIKYVPIVAGVLEVFYFLGTIVSQEMIEYLFREHYSKLYFLFITDALLAALACLTFCYWGSNEEQNWAIRTSGRALKGYTSYPRPDDEDTTILVPERGERRPCDTNLA